jgi:hypothetical protein
MAVFGCTRSEDDCSSAAVRDRLLSTTNTEGTPISKVTTVGGRRDLIQCLSAVPSVRSLRLEEGIGDETIAAIEKGGQQLESLELFGFDEGLSDKSAKIISGLPKLRSLRMGGGPVGDDFARALANPCRIEEFGVSNTLMTVQGVNAICRAFRLKSLRIHGLQGSDDELQLLDLPEGLERLVLPQGSGRKVAKNVSRLSAIKELEAYDSQVDDEALIAISKCKTLESLDLSKSKVTLSLVLVNELRSLTSLSLRECPLASDSLSNLGQLPELRSLTLCGYHVGPRDAQWLSQRASLERLVIDGRNCIDDDCVQAISGLPALKVLHLANSKVTDRGLRALSRMQSLQEVDLEGTNVTRKGVEELRVLPQLREIRLLATNVDAAARDGLRRLFRRKTKIVP